MQVLPYPIIHQTVILPATTDIRFLSVVVTMFGAVFTFVAACAAWAAVIVHSRNARLNMLGQLLDGYASRDMLNAIRELMEWHRAQPDERERNTKFINDLGAGKDEAIELSAHRRYLVHYMNK